MPWETLWIPCPPLFGKRGMFSPAFCSHRARGLLRLSPAVALLRTATEPRGDAWPSCLVGTARPVRAKPEPQRRRQRKGREGEGILRWEKAARSEDLGESCFSPWTRPPFSPLPVLPQFSAPSLREQPCCERLVNRWHVPDLEHCRACQPLVVLCSQKPPGPASRCPV